MIVELEDFAKWCAIQEWQYIREQFEDGEKDFIDLTTKNHKKFENLWFMLGRFREKYGMPHICYDPEGNEITEEEYYQILSDIYKEYEGKS